MMTGQQEFRNKCRELFRFLEKEYACSVVAVENDCGVFITYLNKTTGVRISLEPREGGIFVLLAQLINGKLPPYPIFIKPETKLQSFYLDDIISLKSSLQSHEQTAQNKNSNNELTNKLYYYSTMLKKYASDILLGDFTIFPQLERIVKKRASIDFE